MNSTNSVTDVCRLCCTSEGIKFKIFDPGRDYISKIRQLLPIMIHEHDPWTKLICHRCAFKLQEFYDFREICVQTDNRLKVYGPWEVPRNSSTMSPMSTLSSQSIPLPVHPHMSPHFVSHVPLPHHPTPPPSQPPPPHLPVVQQPMEQGEIKIKQERTDDLPPPLTPQRPVVQQPIIPPQPMVTFNQEGLKSSPASRNTYANVQTATPTDRSSVVTPSRRTSTENTGQSNPNMVFLNSEQGDFLPEEPEAEDSESSGNDNDDGQISDREAVNSRTEEEPNTEIIDSRKETRKRSYSPVKENEVVKQNEVSPPRKKKKKKSSSSSRSRSKSHHKSKVNTSKSSSSSSKHSSSSSSKRTSSSSSSKNSSSLSQESNEPERRKPGPKLRPKIVDNSASGLSENPSSDSKESKHNQSNLKRNESISEENEKSSTHKPGPKSRSKSRENSYEKVEKVEKVDPDVEFVLHRPPNSVLDVIDITDSNDTPAENDSDPEDGLVQNVLLTKIPGICNIYTCSTCESTFTAKSCANAHVCKKKIKGSGLVNDKHKATVNDKHKVLSAVTSVIVPSKTTPSVAASGTVPNTTDRVAESDATPRDVVPPATSKHTTPKEVPPYTSPFSKPRDGVPFAKPKDVVPSAASKDAVPPTTPGEGEATYTTPVSKPREIVLPGKPKNTSSVEKSREVVKPNDVVTPKDVTPKDVVSPKDVVTPKDVATPKDAVSSVDTPNDAAAPLTTPKNAVSPVATPNDAADPATTPKNAVSPLVTPNDAAAPLTTPKNAVSPVVIPNDVAAPLTKPKNVASEKTSEGNPADENFRRNQQ